jgi:hypothetical protein
LHVKLTLDWSVDTDIIVSIKGSVGELREVGVSREGSRGPKTL